MHFLIPEQLPTTGIHLIEASAGTGKTFTVSLIYLQLLMGVRGIAPLTPQQILVVTFTESATQELKARIYSQLSHCLAMLEELPAETSPLQSLVENLSAEERIDVQKRLRKAQTAFDQASIYTIHGFCYQILKYAPLATQNRYHGKEMLEDDQAYYRTAVEDWWRAEVVHAPPEISALVLSYWNTPQALQRQLNGLHRYRKVFCHPPIEREWKQAAKACQNARKELCALWHVHQSTILNLLENCLLSKKHYAMHHLKRWCTAIYQWSTQSQDLLPPSALQRFRTERLIAASSLPSHSVQLRHPVFTAVSKYLDHLEALPASALYDALKSCQRQVALAKQKDQRLHFDDLIVPLAELISNNPAHYLRNYLLETYPAALIDEFQDTDQVQYQLFKGIYQQQANNLLIFIGDPKQAIYRFRGADLAIYAEAKQVVDRTVYLTTNWRAAYELISAVNRLFSIHPEPFLDQKVIPFNPVEAGTEKRAKQLVKYRHPVQSFQIHYLERSCDSAVEFIQVMSEWCASTIAELLNAMAAQTIYLSTYQNQRPLSAEDIVILVRQGDEADAVQRALASKGIASTYLSAKQSVFETPVARRLYAWLDAVQEPHREDKLRRVLCSSWFKYTGAELDQLSSETYDEWARRLTCYRVHWTRFGPLGMIRTSLLEAGIFGRLLQTPQGERELTDLLHLAELLQVHYPLGAPLLGLLNWFRKQISFPLNHPIKGGQQRLERANQLIRITTIHKSKGLEFPIVFIPFACRSRQVKKRKIMHTVRGDCATIHWRETETIHKLEQQEKLAEDLRLIYVAVTRAIYACYLSIGEVVCKGKVFSELNALSYLAQSEPAHAPPNDLYKQLRSHLPEEYTAWIPIKLKADNGFPDPPYVEGKVVNNQPSDYKLCYNCAIFQREIGQNWGLTSYTQLLSSHTEHTSLISLPSVFPSEILLQTTSGPHSNIPSLKPHSSIHQFPKGPQAGVFLHGLLEKSQFEIDLQENELIERLDAVGYERSWSRMLLKWYRSFVITPFPGLNCQLSQLSQDCYQQEFEFTMSIDPQPQHGALQSIIDAHSPVAHIGQKISSQILQGFLKGFIDLVFFYKEKYFIVDYKSNWLGDTPSAYNQEQLQYVMGLHRYDLQYLIYTLALHQYLRGCDPRYSYSTHFGGVYYLFLRGIQPSNTQNGFFFNRPSEACVEKLEQLFMPKAFSLWQETSYGKNFKLSKQDSYNPAYRRTTGDSSTG